MGSVLRELRCGGLGPWDREKEGNSQLSPSHFTCGAEKGTWPAWGAWREDIWNPEPAHNTLSPPSTKSWRPFVFYTLVLRLSESRAEGRLTLKSTSAWDPAAEQADNPHLRGVSCRCPFPTSEPACFHATHPVSVLLHHRLSPGP